MCMVLSTHIPMSACYALYLESFSPSPNLDVISTSSSTLVIVHPFLLLPSCGCDLMSHCGFDSHFAMANDTLTPFLKAAGPFLSELLPGTRYQSNPILP